MRTTKAMTLGVLLGSLVASQAAVVSWGGVGGGIQAGDILETGSPYAAINGGGNGGAPLVVGSNTFVDGVITTAVTGTVSNTGDGGFYSPTTGNANLDIVMDSHTYIANGNPDGRGQMDIPGLTIGNIYQAQFIGVGDDRGCCADRIQFIDDGNGNMSGGLTRGTGDWVVGTFTADATTQSFFVTGATDPGVSGLVIRDLGLVPEPGTTILALLGLLGLVNRRRR